MTLTTEWTGTLERLRLEPGLDLHLLDTLDELVEHTPPADVALVAAAAEARLPERGIHPRLHYLLARLLIRGGDRPAAATALERLLERLNQDGQHALLVEIGRRNADHLPGDRLVPLLVRAARVDPAAVSDQVLAEMYERYPDDPRLHWILGLRGLAAGEATTDTRAHLARALAHLAHEGKPEDLEAAALPVVDALDAETVDDFFAMIAALIERHRIADAHTYLELALDQVLAQGQAPALWNLLRPLLLRAADAAPLRPAALAALARLHPEIPRHERVIATSGLKDPEVPFATAFARYTQLMEFPPGGYVQHGGFGVGEVLDHDGENVTVRFAGRPEHVFKRTLAERALERRDRDDLRVLLAFFPERLAELRERDPAGLVHVALRAAGGEARPRDLKRLLAPAVVPVEGWTEWWKKAQKTMAEDERIDLTQSFRDLVRLAGETAAGQVPLPNFEDRGDTGRQLKLLRRFLEQHPDARERAGRAHGRRLERWLETRPLTSAERILTLIVIAEWDPEAPARLGAALAEVARAGFSLAEFPEIKDQERLLTLGLATADWQPLAMAALDSKQPAIRERALAAIEERLGAAASALYREVIEFSPVRGDAVVEVVQRALTNPTPALAEVPVAELFIAALKLLSDPERETLRKVAQGFLDPEGPLFARLAREPATGPAAEQVEVALLNFRASDRYLFPILAALEQIWGPSVIEVFRRRRERESKKIAARMDDDTGELPVGLMTRASFDALRTELERVDLELKTTIPRAIQKARELGDLRENGEYESAKLKQRQAGERLALLMRQLTEAQVIEDLPADATRVMAGTEVTLYPVDGGDPLTYWVLGDGDSHHGPDVISYRADLGRALWRRRPGDEVDLPLPGGSRRVRIERIARRLPTST
jgi:transcription elongation factor GreA